jgi:hypothetical protein
MSVNVPLGFGVCHPEPFEAQDRLRRGIPWRYRRGSITGLKAWPRPAPAGLRCSLDFARNDPTFRGWLRETLRKLPR